MAIDPSILAKMKASKNKYARGGNTVKLKEGKTTIRLLQKGTSQFWKEIGMHWIKTETDGKPVAVIGCQEETHGKPCAVCAAVEKAMASATDDEKKIIKEWRVKKSVLVHAIMRTGPSASAEPQILELTGTTWSKISGTIEEYQNEGQDPLDPDTGLDFIIERSGKGLNTEYNVMVKPGVSPKVPKDVLDRLPSFDDYIEKEMFKEPERKALTAIANFSGLAVGGLTAVPSSTTKMLSSSVVDDAIVDDAPIEEAAPAEDAEVAAVADALASAEAPVESDEEREERELNEKLALLAKRKAEKAAAEAAALAAKKKAAAGTVVQKDPAADGFTSGMSQADVDKMLAELDD